MKTSKQNLCKLTREVRSEKGLHEQSKEILRDLFHHFSCERSVILARRHRESDHLDDSKSSFLASETWLFTPLSQAAGFCVITVTIRFLLPSYSTMSETFSP